MGLWNDFLNWWNDSPAPAPVPVTSPLAVQVASVESQNAALNDDLTQANSIVSSLKAQILVLSSQISKATGLNQAGIDAQDYWNNKDAQTVIVYADRLVPGTSAPLDMDIRLPCQPCDPFLLQVCQTNGFMVKDPNNCEAEIMAIYTYHQRTWMHWQQEPIWGALEYWCFPFEMRARVADPALGAVCHDFAPSLIAMLLTAGVPRFRVKGICGVTYQNEGHSTVAVLADDLLTWKNLNSTSPVSIIPASFSGLYNYDDPDGPCAIQTAWFSYTADCTWSHGDFSTDPVYQKLIGDALKLTPI
jgi:hypothetical protein